ncbi:MAG: hypothetical protein KIT36_02785 [Alphaproteobacteria bacterium]|nr:hypothetical protein [Alphaproteobacteria bacterium]
MRRLAFVSLAAVALTATASVGRAEPLPRPSVDYAVDGTMTSGKGSFPATMRHGGGKLRVDSEMNGHKSSIFIDIAARTATVVTERMGQKIAVQVDPEQSAGAASFLDRDAKRIGEDKVAGESCDEYEFESAKGRTIRACLTRDGIALRTRDVSRDRVIWEATRVTRGPQNAAALTVPQDAIPLQIPKLK